MPAPDAVAPGLRGRVATDQPLAPVWRMAGMRRFLIHRKMLSCQVRIGVVSRRFCPTAQRVKNALRFSSAIHSIGHRTRKSCMLFRTIDRHAPSPYKKLLWAGIGVVLLGQLGAMYWLCSQQVNEARVRQSATQVQRMSISHCLQSGAQGNGGDCARQFTTANHAGAFRDGDVVTTSRRGPSLALARNLITSATPVSTGYR